LKEAVAQTSAWATFMKWFQNADKNQFMAQINIDEKRNVSAEMFFKAGKGSLQSMFGSDRWYWSQKMKAALGLAGMAGFPCQLSPMKTKTPLPIPAVDFKRMVSGLKKIFNQTINIYVTPDTFFVRKFREIFQQTKLMHSTAAESKNWLGRPDNEILAPTARLCRVLCDTGLWNFSRNL